MFPISRMTSSLPWFTSAEFDYFCVAKKIVPTKYGIRPYVGTLDAKDYRNYTCMFEYDHFWYSPLGEYYCHRQRSDSCRRDFDLVPLICRLWNALSTSGSSVHVYRFSTIFATDRMWLGCMSMYSSWKQQLLLCESCFAEALELPLKSFCVPTLHNPNVNMFPFVESSFWYQALQLFRILSPWQ